MAVQQRSAVTAIAGVDAIVNRDRVNHLNCRKAQVLAFVAGRSPWWELLLHGALGSTFDVYRHCYRRKGYRWDYPAPYVRDEDLAALGWFCGRQARADLDEVRAALPQYLANDQPVLFMAPRADFPYWVDFMRRHGTIEAEYRELHSFMVCGLSADGETVLIVDNTTDNHEYTSFLIPMADLAAGYAREPERWFTDCQTLLRVGEPDLAELALRYHAAVSGYADRFEIYELIADSLPVERAAIAETYRTPSVNSLALLAGSRTMFCRFLRRTSHAPEVPARYERLAAAIGAAQERAGRYHAGAAGVSLDELRRRLRALRAQEEQAARALRDDLRRAPVTFHAAGG
ncbi:hypothetical protein [Dactylosporangium sp. CA-092794]|uniref:hypothetical protein n=1 Tax=Dactylosporangium sp. CA-092794 TaxID=3239929 RepID=UPI003D93613A